MAQAANSVGCWPGAQSECFDYGILETCFEAIEELWWLAGGALLTIWHLDQ